MAECRAQEAVRRGCHEQKEAVLIQMVWARADSNCHPKAEMTGEIRARRGAQKVETLLIDEEKVVGR